MEKIWQKMAKIRQNDVFWQFRLFGGLTEISADFDLNFGIGRTLVLTVKCNCKQTADFDAKMSAILWQEVPNLISRKILKFQHSDFSITV